MFVSQDSGLMALCDSCKSEIKPPAREKLYCSECSGNSFRLESGVGWFCNGCDSGPYIIHRDNKLKLSERSNEEK